MKHHPRLDRDVLPKFQSVCGCGWASQVCTSQGAALVLGYAHYRAATGRNLPMVGRKRAKAKC